MLQARNGNTVKRNQTFMGNNDDLWWVNFIIATQNSDFSVKQITRTLPKAEMVHFKDTKKYLLIAKKQMDGFCSVLVLLLQSAETRMEGQKCVKYEFNVQHGLSSDQEQEVYFTRHT